MAEARAGLDHLKTALNGSGEPAWRQALARVAGAVTGIDEALRMLLMSAGGGERRRAIDLAAELESFRDMAGPLLAQHGVKMDIDCRGSSVLRTEMRPENFHCLLQILTANALDWLKDTAGPRIRVTVRDCKDECELVFANNGPGIAAEIGARVFEPLFSTREAGRGMGLTIARHMLATHGGSLSLLQDGRRKGAHFVVLLPRKKARATI